jgi:hypothetical protein
MGTSTWSSGGYSDRFGQEDEQTACFGIAGQRCEPPNFERLAAFWNPD